MIRKRALLAVVAAAALALTGCGSSSDPLASDSSEASVGAGSSAADTGAGSADADTAAGSSAGVGSASSESGAVGTESSAGSEGSSAGSSGGGAPIVIGSADFTESVIIGEIYAAALNAKGIQASTKPRLGAREVYIKAIEDGSINLVPEYTGTLLQYYDKEATATDTDEVYAALGDALPDGLQVLDKAAAEDKDSLTVTKATADEFGLKSIEDLTGHAQDMVLGGPAEWKTRATGVPGFKRVYGLEFKSFEETDAGGPITIKALETGVIQAGNVFTTDPALGSGDLVALEDTKSLFGAQNVVPLISSDAATDQVAEVLNAVSAELTTEDLIDLNDKVGNQHLDAADVAAEWVSAKGLG